MRKLLSIVLSVVLFTLAIVPSAIAADLADGAKVFSANCASCHAGGKNLIQASKNLKLDTLHKYGMDSAEAIIAQVTKGKAAMPSFKGRLKANQIEDVAAYVLDQANKDWKS